MSTIPLPRARLVAAPLGALLALAGATAASQGVHAQQGTAQTQHGAAQTRHGAAQARHGSIKSPVFHGAKVNAGTVTCAHDAKGLVLTLSDDFVVPETPAPHWQVVDSRGNAFLLNRLVIKGDKLNQTIQVPSYVPDVAKVQIWCAFAEVLLGETDLVCTHATEAGMQFGHESTMFAGAKASKGFVTHVLEGGKSVLVLSDDFVVPDTPAPHWQLVDSSGNVYLLNRLLIKGDKLNRSLVIPPFVRDVAKVQIWCAFAETVLGEASFEKAVR